MYSLVAITGVAETEDPKDSNNVSKGLKCLVQTPKGLEQAIVSCNARYYKAAEAVFEHVNKSIRDHQKNVSSKAKRVHFLH